MTSKKSVKMFGLAKCSTCQKAIKALEAQGFAVQFRDVSTDPLSADEREDMLARFGDKLRNRASLTWRAMSEEERAEPIPTQLATRPALMKRPAIIAGDDHYLGWTANVRRAFGVEV